MDEKNQSQNPQQRRGIAPRGDEACAWSRAARGWWFRASARASTSALVRSVSPFVKARRSGRACWASNGAGKTTCFYMITGLIPADTGTIEVDGHDVTKLPMYRRARLGIGYLPQEASIFRGLTAEQNIRATAELLEPDGARLEAMVEALLAEFGITHIRNTPSVALSAASAAASRSRAAWRRIPPTSCWTNLFAGIDPIAVGEIRDLVKHLKDRGIGVLITDHNVRDALDVIDRAYILHDGRVLKEGTPTEIVSDRDVRARLSRREILPVGVMAGGRSKTRNPAGPSRWS